MISGGSNFDDFTGLNIFFDTEVKNANFIFNFRGVSDSPS